MRARREAVDGEMVGGAGEHGGVRRGLAEGASEGAIDERDERPADGLPLLGRDVVKEGGDAVVDAAAVELVE
jgi:hypothetical protein